VVFSTLTRRAMPFIRYRTGDRSRFVPEPCPCGTVLRRLAHVDERLGTEVVLPSGETVRQRELDEVLFAVDGLLDFRAILAREGEKATLTIEVKSIDGVPEAAVIENALLTIPQLEREAGRARLLLHVQGWQPGDGYGTGTQKRQIVQQGGTE
jgi:phenylacetate-coenzyme A ligase PaaK-like adenylate-forming protein